MEAAVVRWSWGHCRSEAPVWEVRLRRILSPGSGPWFVLVLDDQIMHDHPIGQIADDDERRDLERLDHLGLPKERTRSRCKGHVVFESASPQRQGLGSRR